jgi:hypothetical protein
MSEGSSFMPCWWFVTEAGSVVTGQVVRAYMNIQFLEMGS